MKIESSAVQLKTTHQASQSSSLALRLEGGAEPPAARAPRADEVQLSGLAPETGNAKALEVDDTLDQDPQLALIKRLIEYLTGQPVNITPLEDPSKALEDSDPATLAASLRGDGFSLTVESTYSEQESTTFAAGGRVRTADGREIEFYLSFSLSRSYSESSSLRIAGDQARLKDPLILDFSGDARVLQDMRFSFDLDADGTLDQVPLTGGKGLLAFDRNDNGRIDDGRELFGARTGNGFAELAEHDADGNGWIDENDPVYRKLQVWRPDASGQGTLVGLAEAGVGAIGLQTGATPFAVKGAGNQTLALMRDSGIYLREDGAVGTLSQVDLSV